MLLGSWQHSPGEGKDDGPEGKKEGEAERREGLRTSKSL